MANKGDSTKIGSPINLISGSSTIPGIPELPRIFPGPEHTVMFSINRHGQWSKDNSGIPIPYQAPRPDVWDTGYVRMPFSSHNTVSKNVSGKRILVSRWQMIQQALNSQITNEEMLINVIRSYNQKYENEWKFTALRAFFGGHLSYADKVKFFTYTLPGIANRALSLPNLIKAPIPLLMQHSSKSLSLSQMQVSSLLANAFFCTFPWRNSSDKKGEFGSYPGINFHKLFDARPTNDVLGKLRCIINYFERVCFEHPQGVVTFARRYVPKAQCPTWAASRAAFAGLPLLVDCVSSLSDADGLIQVDFANKYIGGGVIGHGSVQEEIMFATRTEMLVSRLFTEVLHDTEALMIIGCECYNLHTGYSRTFAWAGDYRDTAPRDHSGRRRVTVLAIDAIQFDKTNHVSEHKMGMIERELTKAWVGMSFFTENDNSWHFPGVATGNWGCGAFKGSKPLKALIQMMACAVAKRPMAFYTFNDRHLMYRIHEIHAILESYNITIGELYGHLTNFIISGTSPSKLIDYIEESIKRAAVNNAPAGQRKPVVKHPRRGHNNKQRRQRQRHEGVPHSNQNPTGLLSSTDDSDANEPTQEAEGKRSE